MGHKSRRRRRERALACNPEPVAVTTPPAPAPLGGSWVTRFAVVFLIIFALLWLFAPQEPNQE